MAFAISLETNETIDYIIWKMPITQAFLLCNFTVSLRSGEEYESKMTILSRRKKVELLKKHYIGK